MKIYLVGGAVRDELLGLPIKERDWVVVGSAPEELLQAGYESVGKSFPVFLHPQTKEEYALARVERKVGLGYHGFDFDTSKTVTLEEDLQRRDLTINAMAKTEKGELVDPYGGQRDLQNRVLRHVSKAFIEDPVRVLRVARFAARFAPLGFTVAPETLSLMQEMTQHGELDALIPERIFKELELALQSAAPVAFIQVLRQCDALHKILPEVNALYGVEQSLEHHPEKDTGIHIELVLAQATRLTEDSVVRFAALLHDVGKALTDKALLPDHHGHEIKGLELVKKLCARLHVPKEYQQLAELVAKLHGECHSISKKTPEEILALIEKCDAFRRPERFEQFLIACEADSKGRPGYENKPYLPKEILSKAYQSALSVDVKAVIDRVAQRTGEQIQKALHAARLDKITAQLK